MSDLDFIKFFPTAKETNAQFREVKEKLNSGNLSPFPKIIESAISRIIPIGTCL